MVCEMSTKTKHICASQGTRSFSENFYHFVWGKGLVQKINNQLVHVTWEKGMPGKQALHMFGKSGLQSLVKLLGENPTLSIGEVGCFEWIQKT